MLYLLDVRQIDGNNFQEPILRMRIFDRQINLFSAYFFV